MSPYESFCQRMWLDYCDEHQQPIGGGKLLNYDEYCDQYSTYLEEKYVAGITKTVSTLSH